MDRVPEVRVAVLGPMGAGKTSLVLRYITGLFPQERSLQSNVEASHRKNVLIEAGAKGTERESVTLNVTDLAHVDDAHLPALPSLHQANACFLCFAPSRDDHQESLVSLHVAISQAKGLSPFVVLVALRSDLESVERWRRGACLRMAEELGVRAFFEVSAKSGDNVQVLFEWSAAAVLNEMRQSVGRGKRTSGSEKKPKESTTGAGSFIARLSPFKLKRRGSKEIEVSAEDLGALHCVYARAPPKSMPSPRSSRKSAGAVPLSSSSGATHTNNSNNKSPSPSSKDMPPSLLRTRTRSAGDESELRNERSTSGGNVVKQASTPGPPTLPRANSRPDMLAQSPSSPPTVSAPSSPAGSTTSLDLSGVASPSGDLDSGNYYTPSAGVLCPICGVLFNASDIGRHANACLDAKGSPGAARTLAARPQAVAFSMAAFVAFAGIGDVESEPFLRRATSEGCCEAEVALALSADDLQALGMARLGDRKKYLAAVKRWHDEENVPSSGLTGGGGGSASQLPLSGSLADSRGDAPPSPEPLVTIGAEEIEMGAVVGAGHFGTVYRGVWRMARVAVKVLNDSAPQEEFLKEASMLQALSARGHPNVLRFFGISRVENQTRLALVMEYLSNGSLRAFLQARGASLSRRVLLSFAKSAAAGMLHLASHSPPILHRDLSARNLLVGDEDAEEGTYALRLADFGLSRRADFSGDYAVHSATPTRWTAPEVWKTRQHSTSSDVWSFGIVLWEIFTLGERPYDDLKDEEVCSKVRGGHLLERISPHGRDVGPEIYLLMCACWTTEPSLRPGWRVLYAAMHRLEADEVRRSKEIFPSHEVGVHPQSP